MVHGYLGALSAAGHILSPAATATATATEGRDGPVRMTGTESMIIVAPCVRRLQSPAQSGIFMGANRAGSWHGSPPATMIAVWGVPFDIPCCAAAAMAVAASGLPERATNAAVTGRARSSMALRGRSGRG